jgi:3-isopropylmalate/(R)-2-methylmalate dehydratase small subunit
MEPVTIVSGQMAPLPRANIDTDAIIPKQFLKRIERSGFGPFLFYDWAFDEEGEPVAGFVTNRPEYAEAVVLVSGPNFGSGSSREHAPWSLQDWGFEAVVAPSFADIFFNNCINIGLLPVILAEDEVAALTSIAEDPANHVTVDVDSQTVVARTGTTTTFEARFDLEPFVKHRLLNGLDRIALTLEHGDHIDRYEDGRLPFKPVLT